MIDSPLSESLATLSRFFVGDGTLEQTLRRMTDLTIEAIPATDLVGITMMVEGRPRTAVFTDEAAVEIDQAQYDAGDGPCLTAFESQRVQTIESTHDGGPWPAFREAAAAHGIGSTLSLPLVADTRSVGAMNLYSRQERGFGQRERDVGELFATQAAIVLANSHAYWDARTLSENIIEAMKHRAVIEQAKGILMGAQRCDEDAAFELLVRASQRENVKLRDIAKRIVANTVNKEDDPTG